MPQLYTLKVTLSGLKPPVWRRLRVPAEITLDRLHDVIQIAMGWQEMHLHEYLIMGQRFTEMSEGPDDGEEEGNYRLAQLILEEGQEFEYLYDIGDNWNHEILVERIDTVPAEEGGLMECLGGERACPPEDIGGVSGYEEFLKVLADPEHPDREDYLAWFGGGLDAEKFDADFVNFELAKYVRWSRKRLLD